MAQPLISVITPLKSHAEYVKRMLVTLQQQTFTGWECQVILDGYDEAAHKEVTSLSYDDDRIQVAWFNETMGVAAARNLAVKLTKARWLLPFDADDEMKPRYLERLIDTAEQNTDLKRFPVVYAAAECLRSDDSSYVFKYPAYDPKTFTDKFQIPNSSLHERALWEELGGWDERWVNGAEDWHYWTRAVAKDLLSPMRIDEDLWVYREHDGARNSRIGKRHWMTHKDTLDAILRGEVI